MSRTRSIPDEALLDGALAVIRRAEPQRVTFAAVAAETGLAAATLVQRFGTKPALIRAAPLRAWDRLDARTATGDAAAPLTPEGAVALLVDLSGDYGEGYADALLILREDLRDPVLCRPIGRRGAVAGCSDVVELRPRRAGDAGGGAGAAGLAGGGGARVQTVTTR